ncbi:hypothetical protein Q4S45_07515 [Massilia sp. R2A-15]|uniref:hypothetical protein n=1 Tax=Massilia sp. R2A-15 TaxID=3064278 RepID=UPI002737257D|nr:hypothetical protein [Massilia sp. R2A-15]WLI90956.1 hypothetical protein Q4S45_07515 [Massilia sp. R2A-15]
MESQFDPDAGTVMDGGRIVAFSFNKFVNDICKDGHCFICGTPRDETFNDEHVIPKWLLRWAGLFDQSITLPNTVKLKYSQYTLPCCRECNSFYGKNLEERVQPLLTQGYASLTAGLDRKSSELLFVWVAFVFFKTHLKDTQLRLHLNKQKGEQPISSKYDFAWLHHIHAVIRSIYTGAKLEPACIGTFLVLNAPEGPTSTPFDFRDINGINTILLRVGDTALLASLDDAKLSQPFLKGHIDATAGKPMSPIQLREMLAHLSFVSWSLSHRPLFRNEYDPAARTSTIRAAVPQQVQMANAPKTTFGQMLYLCTFDMLPKLGIRDLAALEAEVKTGEVGFIFDENGDFHVNGAMR